MRAGHWEWAAAVGVQAAVGVGAGRPWGRAAAGTPATAAECEGVFATWKGGTAMVEQVAADECWLWAQNFVDSPCALRALSCSLQQHGDQHYHEAAAAAPAQLGLALSCRRAVRRLVF